MATIVEEYDQVCVNCTMFLANGEVFDNHEDVTEKVLNLITENLGAAVKWIVNACDEECEREVIGVCDLCGEDPEDGYWMGHKAALIYSGDIKLSEPLGWLREVEERWVKVRPGFLLTRFAAGEAVDLDNLWQEIVSIEMYHSWNSDRHVKAKCTRDMDLIHDLIVDLVKGEQR